MGNGKVVVGVFDRPVKEEDMEGNVGVAGGGCCGG